jgi:hypothetical protein
LVVYVVYRLAVSVWPAQPQKLGWLSLLSGAFARFLAGIS